MREVNILPALHLYNDNFNFNANKLKYDTKINEATRVFMSQP